MFAVLAGRDARVGPARVEAGAALPGGGVVAQPVASRGTDGGEPAGHRRCGRTAPEAEQCWRPRIPLLRIDGVALVGALAGGRGPGGRRSRPGRRCRRAADRHGRCGTAAVCCAWRSPPHDGCGVAGRVLAWFDAGRHDVLLTPAVAGPPVRAGAMRHRGYLSTTMLSASRVPYAGLEPGGSAGRGRPGVRVAVRWRSSWWAGGRRAGAAGDGGTDRGPGGPDARLGRTTTEAPDRRERRRTAVTGAVGRRAVLIGPAATPAAISAADPPVPSAPRRSPPPTHRCAASSPPLPRPLRLRAEQQAA
jgi:hypothetical protein